MAEPSVVDAVRALVAFTFRDVSGRTSSDGRYVAEGLRHLAASIDALARRDTAGALHAQVATALGRAAAELEQESDDHVQSSIARAAFLSAAGSIAALQEHRFPHLSDTGADVWRAASRLRANELLAAQWMLVDEFFAVTSDALVAMTWRSL